MLYNIGIPGLIIILVILLIIVGPSKLPEVGRSLGRSITEFKNETKSSTNDTNKGEKEE